MPPKVSLQLVRIILGLMIVLVFTGPLRAGVAVSPLKQEINLRPGEPATIKLTVTNNARGDADPPQTVNISLADVKVSDNGALDFREAASLPNSAANWVVISKKDVILQPGKSEFIECTITPPASAAPGEYYVSVLVTLANKERTEKGLMIEYRIASGIFVTVEGRAFPKQAKIARCELIWPEVAASQPAASPQGPQNPSRPQESPLAPKISVLLQNTGQTRFEASGRFSLVDDKGRVAVSGPLGSQRPLVFGGDSRLFEGPITKALAAGKYRLKVEMNYESSWAMARYEMPLEILPESADAMAKMHGRDPQAVFPAEVLPDRLIPTIPAGATRSLAVTVRNVRDFGLGCTVKVAASDTPSPSDAWISLTPGTFEITRAGRKSIEVKIKVPADAKAGVYLSHLSLEAGQDGASPGKLMIPIELEVRSEKAP